MIEIKAFNETEKGFDCMVHVDGEAKVVIPELISIFDRIYESAPMLFEMALLDCKYTEDHT